MSCVEKLDGLTPHKFETWVRSVRCAFQLVRGASRADFACLLSMTIKSDVLDILDTAPDGTQEDPDEIVRYLRKAARPNEDSEKHRLLQRLLAWKQGSRSHADYVHAFEKLLTKMKINGMKLPESVAAFILLYGLTSSSQRDIILSQAASTDYARVRAAIMALATGHPPMQSEHGHWCDDEVEDDGENGDSASQAGGRGRFSHRGRGRGGRDGDRRVCYECRKRGHVAENCQSCVLQVRQEGAYRKELP